MAPAELLTLDARIARLRERLASGDPDMEADEIQAAIDLQPCRGGNSTLMSESH